MLIAVRTGCIFILRIVHITSKEYLVLFCFFVISDFLSITPRIVSDGLFLTTLRVVIIVVMVQTRMISKISKILSPPTTLSHVGRVRVDLL